MAGVVLVHGLYHCPGHFAAVTESLRAAGVEVAVPELHRGSLAADTVAVQAAVDDFWEPPVVLGPEALAARAVNMLRAQAPGCGRGVPERYSWKQSPSTYVVPSP